MSPWRCRLDVIKTTNHGWTEKLSCCWAGIKVEKEKKRRSKGTSMRGTLRVSGRESNISQTSRAKTKTQAPRLAANWQRNSTTFLRALRWRGWSLNWHSLPPLMNWNAGEQVRRALLSVNPKLYQQLQMDQWLPNGPPTGWVPTSLWSWPSVQGPHRAVCGARCFILCALTTTHQPRITTSSLSLQMTLPW